MVATACGWRPGTLGRAVSIMRRLSGQDRKALAAQMKADIDAACVALYTDKPRSHLGASVIGEKCARKLWYAFRWMHQEQLSGKQLRLFNRGHKEEDRLIEWIKLTGAEVFSHTDDGKQFRISASGGHFGGSLDGALKLPTRYGLDIPFLAEFKTHNDRQFKRLVKDGVRLSHPKHFDQMSTYGAVYELAYAFYFAICKNDDEIHIEVVELDHALGRRNLSKADNIILSRIAPGRIAASPAHADCSYCPMAGICHHGGAVDRNCRSCTHAVPIDGAQWYCERHATQLDDMVACDDWQELEHR
jgi:hypothetical protein